MKAYLVCEGGLGNQLFQWNAAHYLKTKTKAKVVIIMPRQSTRRNELQELLPYCEHKIELIENESIFKILRGIDRIVGKLPMLGVIIRTLGLIQYNSPFSELRPLNRLISIHRGYFQNSGMVEELKHIVMREISNLTQDTISAINSTFYIPKIYQAFHIRRGDLLDNLDSIGVLTNEYYADLRIDIPLVISTERLEELTETFDALYISTSDNNTNWEAFSILCNAERLIMANSTFSWWSGKVNQYLNPTHTIIAPSTFYKSEPTGERLATDFFEHSKAEFY